LRMPITRVEGARSGAAAGIRAISEPKSGFSLSTATGWR
jgi:hypothetical protein